MKKPGCYECEYRGTIPGDAHSCCKHPLVKADDNMFGALVETLQGKFNKICLKLNIQGNPHGIKNGWFNWPANFDPVWLDNCDGFKAKQAKAEGA